jgi:MFS family permease
MCSALSGGFFMQRYSKWTMLMSMNGVVIIGSLVSLVDNIYVICLGRFVQGLAMGGFTVYVPNFINETVPIELKGTI